MLLVGRRFVERRVRRVVIWEISSWVLAILVFFIFFSWCVGLVWFCFLVSWLAR